MKAVLRGVKYTVSRRRAPKWEGYDGQTTDPKGPSPLLWVKPALKGKEELETILHEALHACYWDLDEEAVGETAQDVAALLWQMGYRKTRKKAV